MTDTVLIVFGLLSNSYCDELLSLLDLVAGGSFALLKRWVCEGALLMMEVGRLFIRYQFAQHC